MKSVKICLVVLGVLALAFISMPMRAQQQQYPFPGFPPEMSPLRTFRTPPAQASLVPATKFVKVHNANPNKYIVVLNDDVVSSSAPVNVRRAQITGIADGLAQLHGGKRGFVYESALKGFSIELPDEAAAIALSQNPQVKWVEEDGAAQQGTCQTTNLPWGLDRIDQIDRLPSGGVDTNSFLSTYNGASYCYTNTGANVNAYVLDTGIYAGNVEFGGRAYKSTDCTGFVNGVPVCVDDTSNTSNTGTNEFNNHGTHVAGTVGSAKYGVAKGVNIRSVKIDNAHISTIIAGINWITAQHNANPSVPAVANSSSYCSVGAGDLDPDCGTTWDDAVRSSINSGVTYTLIAGNGTEPNSPTVGVDVANTSPGGRVVAALTVAATRFPPFASYSDSRLYLSNFGPGVDLFAPGERVVSTCSDTNCSKDATSVAAPHVAGAVAMYLEGRTGALGCDCFSLYNSKVPDNPPASLFAKLSTCPDRVAQFIKSNATLSKIDASTIGTGSPNRLLNTSSATNPPTNPINNQRFFVWQHYADFLPKAAASPSPYPNSCDSTNPENGKLPSEPDEDGLNFWTSNITGCGVVGGCPQYSPPPTGCGTDFNNNNPCTDGKRVDVSRAFWVAVYPSWFNSSYGLTNFDQSIPSPCGGSDTYSTPNEKFLDETYCVYLRRRPPHTDASGFNFWLNILNDPANGYGNPANQAGVNRIIEAFITCPEYRERFGQP